MTIRLHEKFSPLGKLILGALVATVLGLAVPALASAAWTVDSTGDLPDHTAKDGLCQTEANTCTLRAAIEESNEEGGSQEIFFGPTFNGGAGSTIVLGSALPAFTPQRGEINGISAGTCTTASLVAGPCVEIDAPAGAKTLAVTGSGEMTIKGLDLTGGEVGLEAIPSLPGAGGRTIEENWIGKKLDGTAAAATSIGINVADASKIVGNSISGGQVGIHTSGIDAQGNPIRQNVISGATTAGILIENSSNQIYGNQVSNSGVGIRVHEGAVVAEENKIGGVQFGPTDADANLITGSTGAAIEVNTASTSTTNVLRNSGSGNGGSFIALVKKSAGESTGPNNGIQPPVITAATATTASGTGIPGANLRLYGNSSLSAGEMGAFLGLTEVDPTGKWTLTYSTSGAAAFAASQTATNEDEGGSSELAFTWRGLAVQKGGTGSGTVTSTPTGINCGSHCEAHFAKGASLKLVGTPDAGSQAVTWAGCDAVNGAGECEVTMSAAKSVTATFNLIPTGGGGGGGVENPSGGDTGGGSGGSGSSGSTSTPTPAPSKPTTPSKSAPKPLKCKAGFKKKTVKGKASCVKVQKAHKKH